MGGVQARGARVPALVAFVPCERGTPTNTGDGAVYTLTNSAAAFTCAARSACRRHSASASVATYATGGLGTGANLGSAGRRDAVRQRQAPVRQRGQQLDLRVRRIPDDGLRLEDVFVERDPPDQRHRPQEPALRALNASSSAITGFKVDGNGAASSESIEGSQPLLGSNIAQVAVLAERLVARRDREGHEHDRHLRGRRRPPAGRRVDPLGGRNAVRFALEPLSATRSFWEGPGLGLLVMRLSTSGARVITGAVPTSGCTVLARRAPPQTPAARPSRGFDRRGRSSLAPRPERCDRRARGGRASV